MPLDKAAVLTVGIAQNHPLPDGNKRLAWQALTVFLALNHWTLEPSTDDAVASMFAVGAGELDESGLATWLRGRAESVETVTGAIRYWMLVTNLMGW